MILLEPDPVNTGVGKRRGYTSALSPTLGASCFTFSRCSMLPSRFLFAVFIVGCWLLTTAHAQQQKKPNRKDTTVYVAPSVTVTSTKATEGKSPVTFNELTKAELREQYTVQDVPKLLSDLPSTVFYSENGNGIGYSYISLRGFDQRRIAVLVNGIPQNDPEDHNVYWIDLPDLSSSVENVQVQRGAGLVNYGQPAIGGSISMMTSNFANKRFVRFTGGIGLQEYTGLDNLIPTDAPALHQSKTSLEVSSGLVDEKYAVYARVSRIASRGYRDYSWADLHSYFLSAVRFDDNVTTQINVFGGPLADGLAYTGMPKEYINNPTLRRSNQNYWEYDSTLRAVGYSANRRPQEIENFSQPHYEILNDVTLSDSLTVKSSLFYYTGDGFFDFDGSWADAATLRLDKLHSGIDSAAPTNAILRASVSNKHGGWIPRVVWKHTDGELTAGAELRWHRSEHWGTISYAENLPVGYNPDFRMYTYNGLRNITSVFAREQYRNSENITTTIEAQLVSSVYAISNERAGNIFTQYTTTDNTTIGNGNELFRVNYLFLNPRAGVNWRIDENNSAYMSVAYTHREPRMGNLYKADEAYYSGAAPLFETDTTGGVTRYNFTKPLIKPEKLLDIELGYTHRTQSYMVTATAYVMDFRDELVKSGKRDIFGNPIDGNAPHARHIGIELQASAVVLQHSQHTLELLANATISQNRFLDYTYNIGNVAIDLANTPQGKGNQIAGFPEQMANVSLRYTYNGLTAQITGKYVGEMRSDNFGQNIGYYQSLGAAIPYADNRIDPYTVINANIGYRINNILSLNSLRLQLQVNNLSNQLYAAGANGAEFFPAAERNWYLGIEAEL